MSVYELPRQYENCCQECDKTKSKIDEENKQFDQPFVCITTHSGFRSVCLDPWVLDKAGAGYKNLSLSECTDNILSHEYSLI